MYSPEGLDTGEQTSTIDDTRSHTPTPSTTPNAEKDAHLYSVDARELLALYTPCQFHSFRNLETVVLAFKASHLSINYEESLAPTIMAPAAEPLCTQLDYITLEGRSNTWNNWSVCLLDFLKKCHVKFRMIIQVFGTVSFHSSIPDDEGEKFGSTSSPGLLYNPTKRGEDLLFLMNDSDDKEEIFSISKSQGRRTCLKLSPMILFCVTHPMSDYLEKGIKLFTLFCSLLYVLLKGDAYGRGVLEQRSIYNLEYFRVIKNLHQNVWTATSCILKAYREKRHTHMSKLPHYFRKLSIRLCAYISCIVPCVVGKS
jgi:hypothetical protein